ncbi:MAG: phenylalanine--tRNA ligase subunit beta, partial [Pirellulaceae bacterium]
AEFEQRLMMAGLNHEGTESVDDDLAIDLEVTSNRPDCLGHLGVAREAAVLFGKALTIPKPAPAEGAASVADLVSVRIACPELCYRYTARVIRGVKIGPSPDWLVSRLKTIGIASVNNVVDITNYVLMECGQPLHAFDLAKLAGPEIIVREARQGEEFLAIDHKTYTLEPGMCVIADASRAVALGGVMGGADSEVSEATVDLLIESAEFSPVSIRGTARSLNLHSPSSHRFERGLDPVGVDWASRRCCEMILDLAGGELAAGVIDVGRERVKPEPVVLRLSQLKRILGIDVPANEVQRILTALGIELVRAGADTAEVIPPSWRRDLTREIDLVEEIARIHGYDKIPEDAAVPMCPSHRSDADRVLGKVRHALTATGFDEALTASVVTESWTKAFSPWTTAKPLRSLTPTLKGADRLRLSLIPSLLDVRKMNESVSNPVIELFETARIYLPSDEALPIEQHTLGVTSGGD